jgi:hypothetical protein
MTVEIRIQFKSINQLSSTQQQWLLFHHQHQFLQQPNRAKAGPFVAGASISTFMKYYTNASQDEYNQKYGALMGVFASVPGGPTPQ